MITNINLSNFRNHKHGRLSAGGHSNIIITGPNGSGKTAVLESISVFSSGGGLRGANMSEIANFGTDSFSVKLDLSDGTELSAIWNGEAHRKIRIDGDAAALSDLPSHLPLVWLTPKEDRIFIDAASDRRIFFDRLVSAFNPSHAGRVARLNKLLSERAFALKNGSNNAWLTPIELNIAQIAASIASARIKYASEINYILSNESRINSFESQLSLAGWFESRITAGISSSDIENEYISYLAQNRDLVSDKMVIDGAHKSDFGMFSNKLSLPITLASTGQQKMALLGLILAHSRLVYSSIGKTPIILLDEAVAHLDESARLALFSSLSESHAQVWATGIDESVFACVPDAQFVSCDNGQIMQT